MIFEHLHIASFGGLADKTLDFSDGVNIVEGANESGKSTICAFLRFMFYGLPSKADDKARAISLRDSRAAGNLTFSDDGKRYRIEREAVCVSGAESSTSTAISALPPLENSMVSVYEPRDRVASHSACSWMPRSVVT